MKTILIPIFHGHVSRNFFLTDIYKILSSRDDLRLVIMTYDFKKDYFSRLYSKPNVIVDSINFNNIEFGFTDRFFKYLFSYSINTPRVRQVFRETVDDGGSYITYTFKLIITFIISGIPFSRDLIRAAYFYLVKPKKEFLKLFDKYRPDFVLLPDMSFTADTYMLRIAKDRKIPSVGILRSFDVITSNKGTVRIKPDHFIVHNEFMKNLLVEWVNFPPNKTFVLGMPHFDYYVKDKPTSKEEFFNSMGLDISKRYILYALTGPRTSRINQDIIDIISKAIDSGELPSDLQILVSVHPNSDPEIFKHNKYVVTVRKSGQYFSDSRLSDMEFTPEWRQWLLDTIYYSSVTINSQGTMTIDAAVLDKPIINIGFDGYIKLPYHQSVARLYDLDHYQQIIESKGARIVYNKIDLIKWINSYLKDSSLDHSGRLRIIRDQVVFSDGSSAEKTANQILNLFHLNP